MRAPKVVAKGADLVAERIKELAKAHSIPIVENPPLAQALFRFVQIDREIPEALFEAVAQVLAYVYALRSSAYRVSSSVSEPETRNPEPETQNAGLGTRHG